MNARRFVIIGGGIAGTTAAEELRKRLPDAEIVLVSEEFHPLYSRVLLPHYLHGKVPRERVFLRKEEWYEANGIEWLPGTFVSSLDARNAFVALSDGRELPYEKLLIATGGQPRPGAFGGRNACHFQTLDDADHIKKLLDEGAARALVYGGGFIACEFVNLFAARTLPMEVRLRGDRFFSSSLGDAAWELLRAKLEASGTTLVAKAAGTEPPADGIVGLGLGLEADLSWVREAGIEVGQGIRANERLETNLPGVWTAGDVAEFNDLTVGRPRMVGTWMNAQMQGRLVAANMAGERQAFSLVSSYATNLLGTPITFIGDTSLAYAQETASATQPDGGVIQTFGRGGTLVGAALVGTSAARQRLTDAIRSAAPFGTVKV